MSTDLESDSELIALRNELLTGLQKKQLSKKNSFENALQNDSVNTKENNESEQDEELEMLRSQALSAKRIKSYSIIDNDSTSLNVKKKMLPGRFRYDRDSDDEEDEEDEDENDAFKSVSGNNQFNETESSVNESLNSELKKNSNLYQEYEPADSNNNFDHFSIQHQDDNRNHYLSDYNNSETKNFSEKPDLNNYHCKNYQTYRTECSKLMSHDAYDPNSLYEPQNSTLPQDFDLRNFLREKALHQQEQLNHSQININNNNFLNDIPDGIVYSEPITKPIEINLDFNYNKHRNKLNYSRYNNNINSNHNIENFMYNNNKRNEFYNNNVKNEDDNLSMESDTDSEDEFLSNKKLKSVVAVISNEKKTESSNTRHDYNGKERRDSHQRYLVHKRR